MEWLNPIAAIDAAMVSFHEQGTREAFGDREGCKALFDELRAAKPSPNYDALQNLFASLYATLEDARSRHMATGLYRPYERPDNQLPRHRQQSLDFFFCHQFVPSRWNSMLSHCQQTKAGGTHDPTPLCAD